MVVGGGGGGEEKKSRHGIISPHAKFCSDRTKITQKLLIKLKNLLVGRGGEEPFFLNKEQTSVQLSNLDKKSHFR